MAFEAMRYSIASCISTKSNRYVMTPRVDVLAYIYIYIYVCIHVSTQHMYVEAHANAPFIEPPFSFTSKQ